MIVNKKYRELLVNRSMYMYVVCIFYHLGHCWTFQTWIIIIKIDWFHTQKNTKVTHTLLWLFILNIFKLVPSPMVLAVSCHTCYIFDIFCLFTFCSFNYVYVYELYTEERGWYDHPKWIENKLIASKNKKLIIK